MTLKEFIENFQLRLHIQNQGNINIIIVTEVINRTANKLIHT